MEHEHVYDDATGLPSVCPVEGCWFNEDWSDERDRSVVLSPAEYEATAAKVDKLNARAAKRGWTGTVKLTGEFFTKVEHNPLSGMTTRREMVKATIVGDPPKYEGWTFLARADFTPDGDLVVFGAPGACPVDRDAIRPGECDHCHVNRYRKNIYIVSDGDQQLQVGSTCIKDFLGWNVMPVWISADITDYEPDGSVYIPPTWSTETVLAVAWAAIKEFGYVRSDDYNGESTKYVTAAILDPRTERERELAQAIRPHIDDALPMAKRIREWVLSDEFRGGGDYVANLKAIAASEFVPFKMFGFLVSAPQAWARAQERDLIRRQERENTVNDWNGQVGDKLDLTVTVVSVRHIPGDWNTSHLYTMRGSDGRTYKWFASNDVLGVSDTPVAIRGTVKKLDEYQGRKATMLTRVKVV